MGYQILTDEFLEALDAEFKNACYMHRPLNSAHEAAAVIQEEIEEFWDEVKKKRELRDPAKLRKELIQTAAMCWRACNDLGLLSQPSFTYEKDSLAPSAFIPWHRTVAGYKPTGGGGESR